MPGDRRRWSVTDKLAVMTRQATCPLCRKKLGPLADVDFDHVLALSLGGSDTLDNLRAVHRACHALKTFGAGGEKRVTTAGSDAHVRAKVRRIAADPSGGDAFAQEQFRRKVLAPDAMPAKAKRKWPSRPFGNRKGARHGR